MSKLASGTGGTDRAALEAFVAQGDTSVSGVEPSDINDNDIISATSTRDFPDGLFQWVYTPPDGSEEIVSDKIHAEHQKRMAMRWVEGVRMALAGRAQAKIQAAREKAEEDRAKRIREEQFAEDAEIPAAVVAVKPAAKSAAAASKGGDPTDYVQDQLEMARERLRAAETAQQDILREVIGAKRDYEKWKALASALSGVGDGNPVGVPGSVILTQSRP